MGHRGLRIPSHAGCMAVDVRNWDGGAYDFMSTSISSVGSGANNSAKMVDGQHRIDELTTD